VPKAMHPAHASPAKSAQLAAPDPCHAPRLATPTPFKETPTMM